ncbi:hypothetical protein COB55_00660 [Candidatus Wolfebacteria bacterium]|nr:MAG: hypothetical protein COB55_00660 [Candidatus Wolfebacteria bacterium]
MTNSKIITATVWVGLISIFLFLVGLSSSHETVVNLDTFTMPSELVATNVTEEKNPEHLETSEATKGNTDEAIEVQEDLDTISSSTSIPPINKSVTETVTKIVEEISVPKPVTLMTTTEVNTLARNALVNILCTSKGGGLFAPASGSGIIIDPRGIILTNAHVAQYFLIRDYPAPNSITCTIRTGSPAVNTYKARLMYISQNWVNNNRTALTNTEQLVNGSDDFALLLITETTAPNSSLPESFNYIEPNIEPGLPTQNTPVLLAGYPAGFLSGISIQRDLYASTSVVNTRETISYDATGTIDLFALGGSIVAQQGSSGGGVIRFDDGKLQGIISLSTSGESTDDRNLLAISIDHIRRTLIAETFVDMVDILKPTSNLIGFANSFDEDIRETLTEIIVTELDR